jgi:hypothetical protein
LKKQSTLSIVENKPVVKKGEFSLFKASGDLELTEDDADFVLHKISPYFDMGNTALQIEASHAQQKLFLSCLKDVRMGKKQFIRALKHALNTKTYGNKDFLTAVLNYDKTVKYYSWNQVLKLINDQEIYSSSEMVYVEFMNGFKAYVYKHDFTENIMKEVYKKEID